MFPILHLTFQNYLNSVDKRCDP